jgi:UDP-N-acetylglucosamine transferase subunit ALG13
MRVFVSVGTHAQQFDRLLREADAIAGEKNQLQIFAQIGNCTFEPKNFAFKRFLNEREFEAEIKKADLVVSHAGAGTIIHSMLSKKKLIIVPRLKSFGEHTNDHQLDLADALAAEGKAIAVTDVKGLGEAIEKAASFRPNIASNKQRLVKEIKTFIDAV